MGTGSNQISTSRSAWQVLVPVPGKTPFCLCVTSLSLNKLWFVKKNSQRGEAYINQPEKRTKSLCFGTSFCVRTTSSGRMSRTMLISDLQWTKKTMVLYQEEVALKRNTRERERGRDTRLDPFTKKRDRLMIWRTRLRSTLDFKVVRSLLGRSNSEGFVFRRSVAKQSPKERAAWYRVPDPCRFLQPDERNCNPPFLFLLLT